jgi:RHS repeat-associated protein
VGIYDLRASGEWPVDQGPIRHTAVEYDDRYRVRSVSYEFADKADQMQVNNFLPSDPAPISLPIPTLRVQSQTFGYDWQGNVTSSDDDAHLLLQRSSGNASYGEAGGIGPNRVVAGQDQNGSYAVTYDAAGNMTQITGEVTLSGTEYLSLTLSYDWDERGRLRTANRLEDVYEDTVGRCPTGPCEGFPRLVSSTSVANTYLYDAAGARTLHSTTDPLGDSNGTAQEPLYTLDVFPSLRLRRAPWSGKDYEQTIATETPYLVANGASYARLAYDSRLPSPGGSLLHEFIEVGDALGSTTSVVDRETGELVEQVSYLAGGQTETDYRPARWDSFREDFRYTGNNDDYEVGLVYYGERYYVPGLNRWASADPLTIHALGADINPYSFAGASPFRLVDLLGLDVPPGVDLESIQAHEVVGDQVRMSGICSDLVCGSDRVQFWDEPYAPNKSEPRESQAEYLKSPAEVAYTGTITRTEAVQVPNYDAIGFAPQNDGPQVIEVRSEGQKRDDTLKQFVSVAITLLGEPELLGVSEIAAGEGVIEEGAASKILNFADRDLQKGGSFG